LMFLGVAVRLKVKDGFWACFPALFFLGLNLYIFLVTMEMWSI